MEVGTVQRGIARPKRVPRTYFLGGKSVERHEAARGTGGRAPRAWQVAAPRSRYQLSPFAGRLAEICPLGERWYQSHWRSLVHLLICSESPLRGVRLVSAQCHRTHASRSARQPRCTTNRIRRLQSLFTHAALAKQHPERSRQSDRHHGTGHAKPRTQSRHWSRGRPTAVVPLPGSRSTASPSRGHRDPEIHRRIQRRPRTSDGA